MKEKEAKGGVYLDLRQKSQGLRDPSQSDFKPKGKHHTCDGDVWIYLGRKAGCRHSRSVVTPKMLRVGHGGRRTTNLHYKGETYLLELELHAELSASGSVRNCARAELEAGLPGAGTEWSATARGGARELTSSRRSPGA